MGQRFLFLQHGVFSVKIQVQVQGSSIVDMQLARHWRGNASRGQDNGALRTRGKCPVKHQAVNRFAWEVCFAVSVCNT